MEAGILRTVRSFKARGVFCFGGRGWLTTDVLPGQETVCFLQAVAPAQPGRYQMRLDMVSETITWFADVSKGAGLIQEVEVAP